MSRRAAPDSAYPFSRGELCVVAEVPAWVVQNLEDGHILKKPKRGTGHWHRYSPDETLRTMLAKELLRCGLVVSSIHSLFASIEHPIAPSAKPWSWLASEEARTDGACLVLIHRHRALSRGAGTAHLTTAAGATQWLGQQTAIVIDVNSFIREIEARTGRRYEQTSTAPTKDPA
jgi:hypothetical protein